MKITLWRTKTLINTTLSHDLTSVKYIGQFPEKALFGFKLKAGADRSLQFSGRHGGFQFVKANIINSTWGKLTVLLAIIIIISAIISQFGGSCFSTNLRFKTR